jgi:hypothetical protein
MNGQRKPRQARPLNYNPMGTALLNASRLTEAEIADTMQSLHLCEKALREGVATNMQVTIIDSSLSIAAAIEKSGIVRGLGEHIASAQTAMSAIRRRAQRTGVWKPTALHYFELEAIRTAFELHEFQLRQLSAGELQRIVGKLINCTTAQGGEFTRISAEELAQHGLMPATPSRQNVEAQAS